jgi:hypothetical protein
MISPRKPALLVLGRNDNSKKQSVIPTERSEWRDQSCLVAPTAKPREAMVCQGEMMNYVGHNDFSAAPAAQVPVEMTIIKRRVSSRLNGVNGGISHALLCKSSNPGKP